MSAVTVSSAPGSYMESLTTVIVAVPVVFPAVMVIGSPEIV